ncbi:hypothetical protein EV401DRAFT_1976648 [Pisolithus croceorrhizus]|nr:hypothetical protein EV401DRAFT_1976648 [Pisolithus croceorrhizus]
MFLLLLSSVVERVVPHCLDHADTLECVYTCMLHHRHWPARLWKLRQCQNWHKVCTPKLFDDSNVRPGLTMTAE